MRFITINVEVPDSGDVKVEGNVITLPPGAFVTDIMTIGPGSSHKVKIGKGAKVGDITMTDRIDHLDL